MVLGHDVAFEKWTT